MRPEKDVERIKEAENSRGKKKVTGDSRDENRFFLIGSVMAIRGEFSVNDK